MNPFSASQDYMGAPLNQYIDCKHIQIPREESFHSNTNMPILLN